MQNWCAKIKIRAERRIGELLREIDKHPGAATRLHDETALPPKLEDLGIDKTQSHRYQTITCSELRTSGGLLDNIAYFQLTLIENMAIVQLTLSENRFTLTKNSLKTSVSAHTH
jgi:hypothetical protein